MSENRQRSDYVNCKFVSIEDASFLTGLSTKEFNKLYNNDGFFNKAFTSDNLIIKSTIDDWQHGKLARPENSKQHFENVAYQNQLKLEKQERLKDQELLESSIVDAFKAKRHLNKLKTRRS